MVNITELTEDSQREIMGLLQKYWGDPQHFARVLARHSALFGDPISSDELLMFAEALYRHVHLVWAQYFRCVSSPAMLDGALRAVRAQDPQAEKPIQFYAWAGRLVQKNMLAYLNSQRGKECSTMVLKALNAQKSSFIRKYRDSFHSLEEVEKGLRDWFEQNKAFSFNTAEATTILGFVLETARREARDVNLLEHAQPKFSLDSALCFLVHDAEVSQAKHNFLLIGKKTRMRHMERLQRQLLPVLSAKLPSLAKGVRFFQYIIEATLCPYPQPIIYVRGLVQHYYNLAQQSSFFDGLHETQQIEGHFQRLRSKQEINQPVLEMAKALAIFGAPQSDVEFQQRTNRILSLDFTKLFQWPSTLQEAMERMQTSTNTLPK